MDESGYAYNTVAIVTNGSGAATVYSPTLNGKLLVIVYKPGTLATGAVLTITSETTVQPLLIKTGGGTANVTWRPKLATNVNTDASALTDYEHPVLVNERVKVAVVSGGETLTGEIGFITEAYKAR